MFERVAILGVGVMGGSLGRALAEAGAVAEVRGWSPDPAERARAAASDVFTDVPDARRDALADADLVVVATPPLAGLEALAAAAVEARPDATLSDVISLKAPVAETARRVGVADRWVGCHPMAGSERSGFAASRPDLFRGARVWLVSHGDASARVGPVAGLWTALGAEPAEIGVAEHDRLMALASHLPQLTSNALAQVLEASGVDAAALGTGGRDVTRLAASSPEMWREVLASAPPELARGLRELAGTLAEVAAEVEEGRVGDVAERMERTRRWREGT